MRRIFAAALAAALAQTAGAQDKAPPATRDIKECRDIEGKPGELECYRALARPTEAGAIRSEWRLDEGNLSASQLVPHRPTYLILRYTDSVNQQPRRVAAPQGFDSGELKLQISFRGEFISPRQFEALGVGRWRLWYAYTQQSNWQILNEDQSRPFRDTNYEPELILTHTALGGPGAVWPAPALINLGLVHQSNGRSDPESRTWWRTYLQAGWQTSGGSLLARVWRTWREDGMEFDNRDINDFVGRADLMFRSRNTPYGGINVLLRSSLRTGPHRGFLQLDWRTPFKPLNIPFHVQLTHGYGETLLDYDHKQTTLGVGLSFWEW